MSLSDEMYEKFIERLLSDEKTLDKLQEILGERKLVKKEELSVLLEEMKQLRIESNQRFEMLHDTMNKRFEENDKRIEALIKELHEGFEKSDKRFEENDKRIEALIKEMHEGFEKSDRRFEELIQEMHEGFKRIDERLDENDKQFEELKASLVYLNTKADSIGNHSGTLMEKAIIKILREVLLEEGLSGDEIKKIEKLGIRDTEGKFILKDHKIDIDGYIANDRTIIMEIKFKPSKKDIHTFYMKKNAFTYYKKIEPELWLLAVEITEPVKDLAEEYGMKVIYGKLVEPLLY